MGRRAGALKTRGIGGILDYAAEVDLRPAKERAEREAKKRAAGDDRLLLEVRVFVLCMVFRGCGGVFVSPPLLGVCVCLGSEFEFVVVLRSVV